MEKSNGEIVIYQTDNGIAKIDVRLQDETVWLTQNQMVELFGKSKSTISEHISNIYDEKELDANSTVRNFRTVQFEGNREVTRELPHYNLDVIISVGYRVKSPQGTLFRQWATKRIAEYMVKGFALDDERLKGNAGGYYWKELLQRIRDIRTDERLIYRQVLDLYATSCDYDKNAPESIEFFKIYQNKFHFAIHGHTAGELIVERAHYEEPFMGLRSFKGRSPIKAEVSVAKNYLDPEELARMRSLVSGFFDFAELQAKSHTYMYMRDYLKLLDDIITLNRMPVLQSAGTVSFEQAKEYAENEYKLFKERTLSPVEEDYMQVIQQLNHTVHEALKK